MGWQVFLMCWSLAFLLLKLPIFPKQSLGKAVSETSHLKGLFCRAWAELIKVCEMVWGHLLTHFLTQRQCKSKLEILIWFPPSQNAQRTLYSESCGNFFSFLLKVNSIFLNSTSISYLMFRHKTFHKQYTQWGPLWEIKKEKEKRGDSNLLIL